MKPWNKDTPRDDDSAAGVHVVLRDIAAAIDERMSAAFGPGNWPNFAGAPRVLYIHWSRFLDSTAGRSTAIYPTSYTDSPPFGITAGAREYYTGLYLPVGVTLEKLEVLGKGVEGFIHYLDVGGVVDVTLPHTIQSGYPYYVRVLYEGTANVPDSYFGGVKVTYRPGNLSHAI